MGVSVEGMVPAVLLEVWANKSATFLLQMPAAPGSIFLAPTMNYFFIIDESSRSMFWKKQETRQTKQNRLKGLIKVLPTHLGLCVCHKYQGSNQNLKTILPRLTQRWMTTEEVLFPERSESHLPSSYPSPIIVFCPKSRSKTVSQPFPKLCLCSFHK